MKQLHTKYCTQDQHGVEHKELKDVTYPLWQPGVGMGLCEIVYCRIMMSYLQENEAERAN